MTTTTTATTVHASSSNSSSAEEEDAQAPIYMVTVSAPTNIAVIKYWGKASVEWNTPINSSISVTLDQSDLRAVTTVAVSRRFTQDRLWLNGQEVVGSSENKRFRACVDGVKLLASDLVSEEDGHTVYIARDQWPTLKFHVSSYNTFPTAAGLASSAAGYAALVFALAQLMRAVEQYPHQLSTLARQGSGSACRSLYGGLVAWRMGHGPDWHDSLAEPLADEHSWPDMRVLIAVVSAHKKDTSSTQGMETSVQTSTLLAYRASTVVPQRLPLLEQAWHEQDFATFGQLTMQDSNQFHATCLDTYPPIFYMNDISRSIIRLITVYNQYYGEIRAAYTFDAGPNAVLYLLQAHWVEVAAYLLYFFPAPDADAEPYLYVNAQQDPTWLDQVQSHQLDPALIQAGLNTGRVPRAGDVQRVYATRPGPGPQVLEAAASNLDPHTGLNCYHPNNNNNNNN